MNILDEIVFTIDSFPKLNPLPDPLNQSLKVKLPPRNGRSELELPTPWIFCGLNSAVHPKNWPSVCQQLVDCGVSIEFPTAASSGPPAGSAAKRLYRLEIEQPLRAARSNGASLIEVTCRSALRSQWGWPPEVNTPDLLEAWLLSIRAALGDGIPLGLGFPAIASKSVFLQAARLDIDFISIHCEPSQSLDCTVHALTSLRQTLDDANRSHLPIIVRTRSSNPEYQVKLIALGASMVSIDNLLRIPENKKGELSEGYLSSLRTHNDDSTFQTIRMTIQDLSDQLTGILSSTGSQCPAQLQSTLRATSSRAADLARIPYLGT
jgi:hypothetical protein